MTKLLCAKTIQSWLISYLFLSPLKTNMVSLEGLTKVVDPSQLTPEFDGCLEYNHEEWIEIRVAFEDYISNATHMLSRLEELQDILAKKELPQDLEGARNMIEEHSQLKKKVIKAPIEDLDLEGQKLLQRIQSSDSFPKKNSGSGNADLQSLLPKVSAMLDRLHSTRQHLHQMWHVRKLKLDQCFQLRLFEQDAEKVKEKGEGCEKWGYTGKISGSFRLEKGLGQSELLSRCRLETRDESVHSGTAPTSASQGP